MQLTRLLLAGLLAVAALPASAASPRLLPLAGAESFAVVAAGDTLLDVAYRNRLGFDPVVRRNPGVDVWVPEVGTLVRLPTRYVLPDAEPVGLVANLPEMRLYDFTAEESPEVFAIAIGDREDPSPIGRFRIGSKHIDPGWTVPESIREQRPGLPHWVPPGPENPLGSRWMTILTTTYGIHGTNNRWSIGRMATHGCIRLYEVDMQTLFARVPAQTRLAIVYQPVKWGRLGDGLYLEVHPDVYARQPDLVESTLEAARTLGPEASVDLRAVRRALEKAQGVPVGVGTLREPSR